MTSFFPRHSVEWRLEEPQAFRRLSISLVEMALLTGVVLRLLRALTFTHGRASWLFYGAAFLVGLLVLLGMTTAYLANWTLRSWLWRAPLFALVEVAGEMATSLVLIALRREPEGAVRAEFHDWPSMALRAFLQSELSICLWAALLAGVIMFVRRSGIAEGVEEEPVVDPET
jgi:SNF family Na+-dependent transporter